MNITAYHQDSKTDKKGKILYLGEDAYPVSDSNLLLVADGLGGMGAFPHRMFNRNILDRDRFFNTMFKGVLDRPQLEKVRKYAEKTFSELFRSKDDYFDSPDNMKRSGYFASRIVSAILMHEISTNNILNPEIIFSRCSSMKRTELNKYEKYLGRVMSETIREKLFATAENAGLKYETSYVGMALLPSTLSGVIFNEQRDYVDTLYFWVGDSRGYVWTHEGLSQVTEDNDGGAMSEMVNLSYPFTIRCRYLRFSKPCVLLEMSDGFYDCFTAPLDLEYTLLENISLARNEEEASSKLENFFEGYKEDDSSSLVLRTFGYSGFDDFKSELMVRLNDIDRQYIAELPDILTRDYTMELYNRTSSGEDAFDALKSRFWNEESVREYCYNTVKDLGSAEFAANQKRLKEEVLRLNDELRIQRNRIRAYIKNNWIYFRNNVSPLSDKNEKLALEAFSYAKEADNIRASHIKRVKENQRSFQDDSFIIVNEFTKLLNFKFEDMDQDAIKQSEKSIKEMFKYLLSAASGKTLETAEYRNAASDMEKRSAMLCSAEQEEYEKFINILFENKVVPSDRCRKKEKMRRVEMMLSRYLAIEKKIDSLDGGFGDSLNMEAEKYWDNNYKELIEQFMSESTPIPSDLKKEAEQAFFKYDGLEKGIAKRDELYGKYNLTYCRYIKREEQQR